MESLESISSDRQIFTFRGVHYRINDLKLSNLWRSNLNILLRSSHRAGCSRVNTNSVSLAYTLYTSGYLDPESPDYIMVDEFELKEDLYTNNLLSPCVTKVSVTRYDTHFSNSRDSEVWLTKLGNESIFLIATAHPKGMYE